MPWFKVDEKFWAHPKVMQLLQTRHGDAAISLWIRAGTWSAQLLTDGRIPDAALRSLPGKKSAALALVLAGLWEKVEGGYQFRDWLEYQPTAEQTKRQRKADAARQRRHRSGTGHAVTGAVTTSVTPTVTNAVSHATPLPIPIPEREEREFKISDHAHPAPSSLQDARERRRGACAESFDPNQSEPDTRDPEPPGWSPERMALVFQREYLAKTTTAPSMHSRDPALPVRFARMVADTAAAQGTEPEALFCKTLRRWLENAPKGNGARYPFAFFANAWGELVTPDEKAEKTSEIEKELAAVKKMQRDIREGRHNAHR